MAKKKKFYGPKPSDNQPQAEPMNEKDNELQSETPEVEDEQVEETTEEQVEAVDEAPAPAPAPAAPPAPAPIVSAGIQQQLTFIQEQFDRYCQQMAPGKPLSDEEGARQQVALWRLIESVLRKEGEDFAYSFGKLLSLMDRERQGVLHERLRYRFFGALPLGREDARNFESILSALITLSNGQERQFRLKQVDLARVFRQYPDKAAEARVIEFFHD